MKVKYIHVIAARPNFIKAAPLIKEMIRQDIDIKIIHTGQHYDKNMSGNFLSQLNIPDPDYNLGIGSGTHGFQVGTALIEIEKILQLEMPTAIIVYGDVNSTLAASLAAVKLNIPIVHVESGCRSNDKKMPEEINRILTDRISDTLFMTSNDVLDNLKQEGIKETNCHFVGNTMIDSLVEFNNDFDQSNILNELNISKQNYNLCTFHRPSNVDNNKNLIHLMDSLSKVSNETICVFPIHPRTKSRLKKFKIYDKYKKYIKFIDPQNYFDFMCLQKNAKCIITDSGGIQEESSYFNVPCLTLRDNTERPITISAGTNKLIGTSYENLLYEYRNINTLKKSSIDLWDGKSSKRIVEILTEKYKINGKR